VCVCVLLLASVSYLLYQCFAIICRLFIKPAFENKILLSETTPQLLKLH